MFFADFMNLFFAEHLQNIDITDCVWLEQEISIDSQEGSRKIVDLLVQAKTFEPLTGFEYRDGNPLFLAILIEIESKDSSVTIRQRMNEYRWRLTLKLGYPVLPIILFLQVGLEGVSRFYREIRLGSLLLDASECLYVGLPALDAIEYLEGDNILGVALSALMRIPKERVAWLGAEALRKINLAPLQDQQKFILGECVEAYLPLSDEQKQQFEGLLKTERYQEIEAMNITTYERGMEKGLEQGLEKGLEKGLEEGQLIGVRFALSNAVELTFGHVSPMIAAELERFASMAQLKLALKTLKEAVNETEFLTKLQQINAGS